MFEGVQFVPMSSLMVVQFWQVCVVDLRPLHSIPSLILLDSHDSKNCLYDLKIDSKNLLHDYHLTVLDGQLLKVVLV